MSAKGYICSSKTKQRIYRVAADLFLKNGYQNTTLSDIAKKAEVSTGTLYRYYPSKGDFLTEIGKNSVEHLRAFADDLPEDMPASEAVLAVLLEDIRGTQGIFFSPEGAEDVTELQANDIRLAYSYEIYASREHLDAELATRGQLVSIYAAIIQRAKEAGTLTGSYDSRVFAQIVVAIFFQELDKGMYRYDYPYELLFKQKLDILFEGREQAPGAAEELLRQAARKRAACAIPIAALPFESHRSAMSGYLYRNHDRLKAGRHRKEGSRNEEGTSIFKSRTREGFQNARQVRRS